MRWHMRRALEKVYRRVNKTNATKLCRLEPQTNDFRVFLFFSVIANTILGNIKKKDQPNSYELFDNRRREREDREQTEYYHRN